MTDRGYSYTPPLGHAWLTPLYDTAIRVSTREGVWRSAFIKQIAPSPSDRILDVGCGTGTLAVALNRLEPEADIIGIDPDSQALGRAAAKVGTGSRSIRFVQGFLSQAILPASWKPTKIISSLVFHQTPLGTKREIIRMMRSLLAENGEIHIADYGKQQSVLMRLLFRLTVQMLDGVADTQSNADGILPELMHEAGLKVDETRRLVTPTGSISLYRATPYGLLAP
ncbi:class I SAM-dependent methyltransferase [Hyphobacterium sp.]|uniref:class I SAM-dependent methyltransferase n=1 Tax=Hyphobacterium sp. TaxID=2004662 RepID=UPI003B521546